jgi:hypothetical protein
MSHSGDSEREESGNDGATIRLHDGDLQVDAASISTRREDSGIFTRGMK